MNGSIGNKRGLRARAEAQLAAHPPPVAPQAPEAIAHELQVHQVELEMQNEALCEVRTALQSSADDYRNLYEFAPVSYLTLADTGRIIDINLTGALMLGEERKDLRKRSFATFVIPQDRNAWANQFQQALAQDEKVTREFHLLQSNGQHLAISANCQSVMTSRTAPRQIYLSLTDITARAHAMDQLQDREDRLLLAKKIAGLGIYDHNLVTGAHHFDERLREFWGFGPDDPVTYEQIIAGVHPADRAAMLASITQARDPAGDGKYAAEYRVINPIDGSVRHLTAIGQVFFNGMDATRFVGAVRDVSAKRQAEKEMQTWRNEMELLVNRQIAVQTAAAIAHEINQPLNSISAYSEAALRMLLTGMKQPEKMSRALEGAMEQAQRAGDKLHELLDFLHTGEHHPEPVDLNAVIRDAIAMTESNGFGKFRTVVNLERNLPAVLANALQLKKVMLNLLYNALDATRGAGMPTEAITITVRTAAAENMAQVTVQDNGPGLTAENHKRIFCPFFTTKPMGTGLGLTISQALIQAHGGQLWADPGEGQGATFHFTLPFAS